MVNAITSNNFAPNLGNYGQPSENVASLFGGKFHSDPATVFDRVNQIQSGTAEHVNGTLVFHGPVVERDGHTSYFIASGKFKDGDELFVEIDPATLQEKPSVNGQEKAYYQIVDRQNLIFKKLTPSGAGNSAGGRNLWGTAATPETAGTLAHMVEASKTIGVDLGAASRKTEEENTSDLQEFGALAQFYTHAVTAYLRNSASIRDAMYATEEIVEKYNEKLNTLQGTSNNVEIVTDLRSDFEREIAALGKREANPDPYGRAAFIMHAIGDIIAASEHSISQAPSGMQEQLLKQDVLNTKSGAAKIEAEDETRAHLMHKVGHGEMNIRDRFEKLIGGKPDTVPSL